MESATTRRATSPVGAALHERSGPAPGRRSHGREANDRRLG
jgi:hypothetical protein